MLLKKNEELKIFEIWLTETEYKKLDNSKQLNKVFEICKMVEYKPVVFISGNSDLLANTTELIAQNEENASQKSA